MFKISILITILTFQLSVYADPSQICEKHQRELRDSILVYQVLDQVKDFTQYLSFVTKEDLQKLESLKDQTELKDPNTPETPLSQAQLELLNNLTERSGLFNAGYFTQNFMVDLGLSLTKDNRSEFSLELTSRNFQKLSPKAPLTGAILQFRNMPYDNFYSVYVCTNSQVELCILAEVLYSQGRDQREQFVTPIYFSLGEYIADVLNGQCELSGEQREQLSRLNQ